MKKRNLILFFLLILVVIFSSCNKKLSRSQVDTYNYTAEDSTETSASKGTDTRKIVITADYSIETTEFEKSVSKIKELTEGSGGYVEKSDVSGEQDGYGSANFTLRIPADKAGDLDSFFAPVGYVTKGTQGKQDITDTYYDTKSQLDSLNIQYDRITEILKKATALDDILKLETELNRIRTEINTLTNQMKNYDNQVSYATVTVNLYSVTKLSETKGFWQKTGDTISDSFAFAGNIVVALWYILLWLLPYIIVFGIAGIAVLIVMKIKKKKE